MLGPLGRRNDRTCVPSAQGDARCRKAQKKVEPYCGAGPKERPEQCMAALKEHQAFLKGKRKNSPLPLASEFIATARQWITEYNSQHPHGGRGMRGRTPDSG